MSNESKTQTGTRTDIDAARGDVGGKGRRVGFRIVIGLVLALIIATWAALWPPDVTHPVTGWLPDATFDSYAGTFADEELVVELGNLAIHRHHFLAGSLILWTFLIASAVQLRRPETNQAPLWLLAGLVSVFVILETGLVGFDPFTLVFVVLIGAALLLHPRRLPEERISWAGPGRAVALVAAVAAFAYAVSEAVFQVGAGATDVHGLDGHYAFVAVAATTVAFALVLGVSNLTGSRIVAWMGGMMMTLAGAFFIGFPNHASSPGVVLGALTVILGVTYLVTVARRQRVAAGS